MKTLYIGETNSADSKLYYEIDESACNLHIGNYKTALEEKPAGVFYTSLSDFQNVQTKHHTMVQTCLLFDKTIYRPPAVWTNDLVRQNTEEFLKLLSLFRPIDNFIIDYTHRKTEEPQLWIAGCSFSSAVGVTNEQRWATLLADKLNIPLTVLAEAGSGNSYQARKLLSADIRENDIVIFQITAPERETIFHPAHGYIHVGVWSYENTPDLWKTYPPDQLDELTLVINQIKDIQNIVNFLQKTKARFLLWSPGICLPIGEALTLTLRNREYFHLYPNKLVDLVPDGKHPGPKTHKQYADFVFEKFKQQEEQA